MKRKSLLFLLLFALLAPWAANAQDTITVYDGTTTSSYVPFYGLYADWGTRSQFIIPSRQLQDMNGGTIEKLTFYTSTTSASFNEGVTVYLKEVNDTVFSTATLEDWSSMTEVWTGNLTVSNKQLEIDFSDDGYTYGGGHLMIGFQVTTWGSSCPSISWYGVSQSSGTYTAVYNNANSSHQWSSTITRLAFIPKTTFIYEEAQQGGDVCEKPETCVVSDVTSTSATLTWSGGSGTYNVELKGGSYTDWTSVLQGTTLTTTPLSLQPNTSYQARVQSVCTGTTPTSGWKTSAAFNTPCDSYDIPYTYDFEAEAPFACWTPITGVTRATSTSYTHSGSYYLRFASTTSNLVALPQFNEATNNLRVEFWTRPESATNSNCGTFSVGYMTDITDASTFVEVANYAYNDWTSATYEKKTVDFVNAPANANIAFRHNAGSTAWYWFADDVTVKEIPSCLAPTGLAANATTNSADLSWTANSGETDWTLYWKKSTDETYTEVPNATNPYPLTSLDPASTYQYYVVANCSADEASEPSDEFSFITACEAITAYPYTENFDSYTGTTSGSVNNLPICWNYINGCNYSYYAGYPVIYNSSSNSHSGNNHLYFYSYYYSNYTYTPLYAVLPAMENLNGKELTLFAKAYNASSSFKVGMMTDPNDINTFVEIGSKAPSTSAYEECSFILGQGNYVAIMMEAANSSSTSRGIRIDDITIDFAPTCAKPINLTASNLTNHSATLKWNAGSEDQDAWEIAYKKGATFNPNDPELDWTTINVISVTDTAYIFNKTLDAASTYYAYVRANCGDEDYSKWSTVCSFTTKTAAPKPTNFQKKDVGPDYAKLTWKAGGGDFETAWELYYVASSTTPTAPADTTIAMVTVTTLPTDENPYVLEGLANETRYYIWVRADHGTDGKSAWTALSGSYFTTLVACPEPTNLTATNVTPSTATLNWAGYSESYNVHYRTSAYEDAPFMQNFEISLGNWTFTSMNAVNGMGGTGSYPAGIVADAAHNGSYGFRFSSYTTKSDGETYDQYLVSPEMTVTGSLKFYAWTHGAADSLYLGVSTTTNNLDAFTWEKLTFASTYTWLEFTKELSSNVKYIAFHYFGNFAYYCYVDDISIGEIVEIPAGEWLDANSPVAGTTTNIQGLSDGTKYEWQVQPTCAVDPENPENGWTASAYFTTPDACTAPFALDTVAVASNSATLKWTGYQESYNVRYRTAETVDIFVQTGMLASEFDETGWTINNQGEETDYYYLDNAYTYAGFVFVNDSTLTANQYWISPAMTPTISGTTLQFFALPYTEDEYFKVGFSSTDKAVTSFTWNSEEPIAVTSSGYMAMEVPVGTKYIAFQYIPGVEAVAHALCITDVTAYATHNAGAWQYANNVTSPATIDGLNAETWYEWQVQGNLEGCGENDATDWTASKYFQTHKKTTVTQTMELAEGWNWWSTYIEAEDVLAQLKASLGTNGMQISTTGGGLTYRNGRWIGTISSIDNAKGYKIRTNAPVTVTIEGSIVNPDSCLITINEDWNWIGYPLTESQAVGTALAGFPASNGDNIKTQGGGANYRNGRWLPATFTLEPGKSYAYKSNSSEVKTLIFSNSRKAESTPKTNVKPASSVIRIEGLKEVKIENLKKFK